MLRPQLVTQLRREPLTEGSRGKGVDLSGGFASQGFMCPTHLVQDGSSQFLYATYIFEHMLFYFDIRGAQFAAVLINRARYVEGII